MLRHRHKTGPRRLSPSQLHIALSDDPSKLHVSWATTGAK
jgi:hypothetical protein